MLRISWSAETTDVAFFSSSYLLLVTACNHLHEVYSQLHATTCMRCTVNCMQPQEQILCSVLNSKLCVYCFMTPALCSVEFTMHIWDITTPAMCLCVCVPTDRFMSPTQCVGGQGGWFTLWYCTLCGLFQLHFFESGKLTLVVLHNQCWFQAWCFLALG